MHKITKVIANVYDGDSLEDLIELSTCGHSVEIRGSLALLDERVVTGSWIIFIEGETDFRNPGKHRTTERQAEELVWAVHKN
jgi:hypothetical protein|nr:MAG TPA: hypothetical protein [Caudoviricetes sp.]